MNFPAQQIKEIRLRLGWSQAELGRYFGAKVDLVRAWEAGEVLVDPEHHSSFFYLQGYVENVAESIAHWPVAESIIKDKGVNQVTRDELREALDD